jgi:hypothetical protein
LGFEASPGKLFFRLYLKKTHHKKGTGGVAQGVEAPVLPESKPKPNQTKPK